MIPLFSFPSHVSFKQAHVIHFFSIFVSFISGKIPAFNINLAFPIQFLETFTFNSHFLRSFHLPRRNSNNT